MKKSGSWSFPAIFMRMPCIDSQWRWLPRRGMPWADTYGDIKQLTPTSRDGRTEMGAGLQLRAKSTCCRCRSAMMIGLA
jgi:hypothetical protein